jgi:hypothetical protein
MKTWFVVLSVTLIEIAVVGNLSPLTDPARLLTTDFVNFYAAASIVHRGDGAKLYDRETQETALQTLLGRRSTRYFLHPPFEAAALSPLTRLNLKQAFVLVTMINVALLGFLPLVLSQCVPLVSRRPYLGMLGFCFFPTFIALAFAQDSILLLFVVSSSYVLLSKRMDMTAGLVLALAAIKFQYLVILVPLLLLRRRLRLGLGFAIGCGCLTVVCICVTGGVHGLFEYLRFVRDFDANSGYGSLNLAFMVNLRGFLAGMGWMRHWPGYMWIAGLPLFVVGVAATRVSPSQGMEGLLFSLWVTIALAAAPYAHYVDMTLLLLPILLALDYIALNGTGMLTRKLILFACAALVVLPVLLLVQGGFYWWNSRVYLLFPLIVFFIGGLAAELYSRATTKAAPQVAG